MQNLRGCGEGVVRGCGGGVGLRGCGGGVRLRGCGGGVRLRGCGGAVCLVVMEEEESIPMSVGYDKVAGTGFVLEEIIFKAGENNVVESLSNDALFIGRKLTTNTKVPGIIHNVDFTKFWLNEIKSHRFCNDVMEVLSGCKQDICTFR